MKRLRGIAGIRVLLSSWDEPRRGEAAYQRLDKGLEYLQKIHEAVLTSEQNGSPDVLVLTQKTAAATGASSTRCHPAAGQDLCSKSLGKRL